ncbi:MAG: autotransporter domain-containing protein [Sphingomonadales bacterium]|nr:autotransporter domain-containing protein [Sphingomonadales bacterium]
MVIDNGGGFVGLCTATLINPRTVIFAAHCVNSRSATDYGAGQGGTAIAFGFETNTRANAAGQTDELVRWLLGGAGGAGKYQTNLAQNFYNSNWVNYNPLSLEPEARSFLYGDVAMASLDTPAASVPTWALLFSPLTNTSTIGASGTGFNVGMIGYGNNGTGTSGAAGSDFRRRSAENILGALTDLQTFESFLFGGTPNGLTQNLYFLDFDDPRRGLSGASPFDFNAFRDNARTNPNGNSLEGITSQGDSGGPLVLQNFSKQVVIGVLSGGYTRFFSGQPANGYGTVSFYQPLYLYWDWIAANNPYHYVAAKAGDGAWTDASHWVTTLDPSYMILSGGQPVNGIPTLTGEQKDGTSGDFGQICFQSGGVSDCYDTRTGEEVVESRPIGTSDDNAGSATVDEVTAAAATRDGLIPGAQPEAQAAATPLPAATLTNGLPGATNFVPNNVEPVRTAGTPPRYFDVTLSASGLTTLTGASVTVDRLTVATSAAGLRIDSGASLSSLINVNQLAGMVTVNGTLSSVGDYSLMGGALLGSGRINAPFLTSVLGQIAPGTQTAVGTLTVAGNLVLSSGSGLFINFGPNGTSDVLAVVANGTSTGSANLGGAVNFSPAAGYLVKPGDKYTFLTAAGGVTGTFSTLSSTSAILTPKLTYGANAVSVEIQAGLYRNVVSSGSAVQGAYAQLLDQSRGNANLSGVYGLLDQQNAATIQATLESWAPRAETLRGSLATTAADNMSRFYRDRIAGLDAGDMGGTLAMIGKPVQLAALNMNAMGNDNSRTDSAAVRVEEGRLPEDTSAFLAGGYIDGDSRPMASALPGGGRDQFDGFYIAGGIEKALGDSSVIGFALSYTDIDGDTVAGQTANGKLIQGTLYGKTQLGGGIELSTQVSAGAFDSKTTRLATLVGTPFTLTGADSSLLFTGEVTLGKDFDLGSVEFGPRAGLRASHIGFSDIKENGGGPALHLDRDAFNSAQGRLGLELSGKPGASFKPHLRADYVHEFMDAPASFGATFVGGPGPNAVFGLTGTDKDWFEVGGGLTVSTGSIDLSVGAETTIARKDVSYQSYRGTVTFHF